MTTINSGSNYSIAAINWISNNSSVQTFLYAVSSNNWFGVQDNISVNDPGNPLATQYLFSFILCQGSGNINYGDHFNISCNNKYIQCGGGNCSSGVSANCSDGSWQIFKFTSPSGKTGPVYIGETLMIEQVVTPGKYILPAGNSQVWLGSTSNHNEYLQVLLSNGTNGQTASAAQTNYSANFNTALAQQNPVAASLNNVGTSLNNLFNGNYLIYIGIGFALFIVLIIMVKLIL